MGTLLAQPFMKTRKNNGVLWEPDANTVLWLPGQDDPQSLTIKDRSGKGNDGAITNATWARTGQGLWYLDFDGSAYVVGGDVAGLRIAASDPWTLMAWLYLPVFEDAKVLFGFGKAVEGEQRIFHQGGGGIYFWGRGAGNDWNCTSTFTIGVWHHLAFKTDGTTIYLLRNGVELENAALPVNLVNITEGNFFMGRTTAGEESTCSLALMSVFNRELPDSEILSHYNQERHLFGV